MKKLLAFLLLLPCMLWGAQPPYERNIFSTNTQPDSIAAAAAALAGTNKWAGTNILSTQAIVDLEARFGGSGSMDYGVTNTLKAGTNTWTGPNSFSGTSNVLYNWTLMGAGSFVGGIGMYMSNLSAYNFSATNLSGPIIPQIMGIAAVQSQNAITNGCEMVSTNFTGGGSNLVGLNASALASGTVPTDRMTNSFPDWLAPYGTNLCIIGMGDSVMAGTTNSWFWWLTNTWPYNQLWTTNVAVSGAKMASLTNQFAGDYETNTFSTNIWQYRPALTGKPTLVLFQIGVNDVIATGIDVFSNQFNYFVLNQLRSNGFLIGCVTPFQNAIYTTAQGWTNLQQIISLQFWNTNLDFRINSQLFGGVGNTSSDHPAWWSDTIHPNALGAEMFSHFVDAGLRQGKWAVTGWQPQYWTRRIGVDGYAMYGTKKGYELISVSEDGNAATLGGLQAGGSVTSGGHVYVGASSLLYWTGKASLKSPAATQIGLMGGAGAYPLPWLFWGDGSLDSSPTIYCLTGAVPKLTFCAATDSAKACHVTVSSNFVAGGTVTATNGYLTSEGFYLKSTNWIATNAHTFTSPVYSSSSSTSAPSATELTTAAWVRGLFAGGGANYYAGTVQDTGTNTDTPSQPIYQFTSTPQPYSVRSYSLAGVDGYIGSVVTTNKFMNLEGPIVVNANLTLVSSAGGRSASVKPEIYYSYDKTNWFGDWSAPGQNITTGTNQYQWVIGFPGVSATNASGFYVQRRFKITATNGTDQTIVFTLGTNATITTASHISIPASGASGFSIDGSNVVSGTLAAARIPPMPNITNYISIPASAFNPSSNAATAMTITNGNDQTAIPVYAFDDTAKQAVEIYLGQLPDWYPSTFNVKLKWFTTNTPTAVTTNVFWTVAIGAVTNGMGIGTNYGTPVYITNNSAGASLVNVTPASGDITPGGAGLAAGAFLKLRISRTNTVPDQKLIGNAMLVGATLQYRGTNYYSW